MNRSLQIKIIAYLIGMISLPLLIICLLFLSKYNSFMKNNKEKYIEIIKEDKENEKNSSSKSFNNPYVEDEDVIIPITTKYIESLDKLLNTIFRNGVLGLFNL